MYMHTLTLSEFENIWIAGLGVAFPPHVVFNPLTQNPFMGFYYTRLDFISMFLQHLLGSDFNHHFGHKILSFKIRLDNQTSPHRFGVYMESPSIHCWLKNFRFACPPADPVRDAESRWVGFTKVAKYNFWNVRILPEDAEHAEMFNYLRNRSVVNASEFSRNGPMYMFSIKTSRGPIVRFVAVFSPKLDRDMIPLRSYHEILITYRLIDIDKPLQWLKQLSPVVQKPIRPPPNVDLDFLEKLGRNRWVPMIRSRSVSPPRLAVFDTRRCVSEPPEFTYPECPECPPSRH